MRAKTSYYLEQAKKSPELADRVNDEEIAVHLLNVAEQYDKLAGGADTDGLTTHVS